MQLSVMKALSVLFVWLIVIVSLVQLTSPGIGLAQPDALSGPVPAPQTIPGPRAAATRQPAAAVDAPPQPWAGVRDMPNPPKPALPNPLPTEQAGLPAGEDPIPDYQPLSVNALPNMTPFKPVGWDNALLLSAGFGAHTYSNLVTGTTTYVDVAVANYDVGLVGSYYAYLYVDSVYVAYFTFTNHAANTYLSVSDYILPVSPAAGWHYIQLWVDPLNTVVESNENDNLYSLYYYWHDTAQGPNLLPYQVSGWGNAVVLDSQSGTLVDGPLYADIPTYFDLAYANLGTANAAAFTSCLYLDDTTPLNCWRGALNSATYQPILDYTSLVTPAGWHTITLKVDTLNEIAETNETDNSLVVRNQWQYSSKPNLHPAPSDGWSAAIVPASQPLTTQMDVLKGGAPTYIDWSLVNDGGAGVPAVNFLTGLYLDGVLLQSWPYDKGVQVNYFLQVADFQATFTPGYHTLELRADTTNVIQETNETDNVLAIKFYWDGQNVQPVIRVAPVQVNIQLSPGSPLTQTATTLVQPQQLSGPAIDFSQYSGGGVPDYSMPMVSQEVPLPPCGPEALPVRYDMQALVPPVKNQEKTLSCTAWASGYYMKTIQEGIDQGWDISLPQHQFSPSYIWNQISTPILDAQFLNCGGSTHAGALGVLYNQGVVPYSTWPFNPLAGCAPKIPTTAQRDLAANYRISSSVPFFSTYQNRLLTDTVIQSMKQWLTGNQPILLAVDIMLEFDQAKQSPNCVVDLPSKGGYRNTHDIAIIGYDDNINGSNKAGFKIVNSWGTGWGCLGYGYLTYDWLKAHGRQADGMNDIRTGGYYTRDFTIFNDGAAALVISNISKLGASTWVQPVLTTALPITIAPGKSSTVVLTFNTSGLVGTSFSESIRVASNDPVRPLVSIQVNLQTGVAGGAPPNLPSTPSPVDAAPKQHTGALTLRWQASDPDTSSGLLYDVRLEEINPPSKIVCNDVLLAECSLGGLLPNTTYYWRVSINDGVTPTLGPIWSFTTGPWDTDLFLPLVRR